MPRDTLAIPIDPRHGAGASATIGYPVGVNSRHVMWLGPTAAAHTIAHEIGHVLGTVSRDDRIATGVILMSSLGA